MISTKSITIHLLNISHIPPCIERAVELIVMLLLINYLSKWIFGKSIFSGFFQGIGHFINESILTLWKGITGIVSTIIEKCLQFLKIIVEYALEGLGRVLEFTIEKLGEFCLWLSEKLLDLLQWIRSFF